jgi:hypothetical protein
MPGYTAFSFKATSMRPGRGGRLVVRGTVTFTVARGARGAPRSLSDAIDLLQERGYKVGVRLKRGQALEGRGFRGDFGQLAEPDRAVTAELRKTFGEDSGERWHGFLAKGPIKLRPRRSGRTSISFDTTFTVTGVASDPQLVPVVHTYGTSAFRRHYVLGVRILTRSGVLPEVEVRAVR